MCRCTPEIRTPFCGKPGCEWPPQENYLCIKRVGTGTVVESRFFEKIEDAFLYSVRRGDYTVEVYKKVKLKVELAP